VHARGGANSKGCTFAFSFSTPKLLDFGEGKIKRVASSVEQLQVERFASGVDGKTNVTAGGLLRPLLARSLIIKLHEHMPTVLVAGICGDFQQHSGVCPGRSVIPDLSACQTEQHMRPNGSCKMHTPTAWAASAMLSKDAKNVTVSGRRVARLCSDPSSASLLALLTHIGAKSMTSMKGNGSAT
jgi:hypothetical protein